MATARKAMVVTSRELARGRAAGRPAIVQLSSSEYRSLLRGGTRVKALPRHICGGLQLTRLPGSTSYAAIPVCGPDEVPMIGRDGVIRCSKTSSGPRLPSLPSKPRPRGASKLDLLKLLPCGVLLRWAGFCIGSCAAGKRCKKYVLELTHGTYVYCYCGA